MNYNEIPTYNHPTKSDEPAEDKPSFFHHAAKISLFAPIVLGIFLKSIEYGFKDAKSLAFLITLGGGMVMVYLACLAFGVLALFGVFTYGTRGIMVRAVCGIALNLTLLGIFGVGFVRGFQMAMHNRELIARARSKAEAAGTNSAKDLTNSDSVNDGPGKDAAGDQAAGNPAANKATAANSQPPKELTGDMALVAKAKFIYLAKLQTLTTAYDAAALALKTPPLLGMKGVDHREQLLAKKELVNKFLAANEKLLGFTTGAEANLRLELVKLHASPGTIDIALKDYRKSEADRDFIVMKMRTADQRIGTSQLALLNVLDTNWGNWKYNEEQKNLGFQNATMATSYNEGFNELNAATAEQTLLQVELTKSAPVAPALQ